MEQLFYLLAVLACPVGMGAMMWFMMRGGGRQRSGPGPAAHHGKAGDYADFDADSRQRDVAALREEVADLRARLGRRQPDQPQQTPAGERAR